jgi:thiol-disulfide isomerase/thioredoxin
MVLVSALLLKKRVKKKNFFFKKKRIMSTNVVSVNGNEDVRQSGHDIFLENAPGLWFVMFLSPTCLFCRKFSEQYARLADAMVKTSNITVASLDVQRFPAVVDIMNAQESNTFAPFQSVPMFGLFYNGSPIAKYTGRRNASAMRLYLLDQQKQLKTMKQSGTTAQQAAEPLHRGEPGPGLIRIESAFVGDNAYLTVEESGS